MEAGYNIKLKINSKTIIAVTQDDLSVSAQVKESITKDDNGVKQVTVAGQDTTFTVAGLMAFDSASGTTKLDCDDLLEQSLKTGAAAVIPFEYLRGAGKKVTGNCIMTSYSESAPASPDSDTTYSASFRTTGPIATA